MEFDLIIINYNTTKLTIECIDSAKRTFNKDFNIIVVDNGSKTNDTQLILEKYPDVKLIKNKTNLGYAAAINIGVKHSITNNLILSNSDIIFTENSIQIIIDKLNSREADIAGPQQIYPNFMWQQSYGTFPGIKLGILDFLLINIIIRNYNRKFYNYKNPRTKPKKVDFIDGGIIFVRKDIFEKVGGFDTDFDFYSEETAFCYKAKKLNAKIIHYPNSIIIHHRGASYGPEKIPIEYIQKMIYSKIKFCKKYRSKIETKIYILLEAYSFLFSHIMSKLYRPIDKKYGQNYKEIYHIWKKVLNEI